LKKGKLVKVITLRNVSVPWIVTYARVKWQNQILTCCFILMTKHRFVFVMGALKLRCAESIKAWTFLEEWFSFGFCYRVQLFYLLLH
jgi:hypothetical protein